MERDSLRQLVIAKLTGIAPEVDPESIIPDQDLRSQIDLDSMDFLNFVIALSRELGLDIPESDYSKLSTLDSSVDYLSDRLASPPGQ
ncbi:MAG: acyl carrier protein [Blastocatellales bacterium]